MAVDLMKTNLGGDELSLVDSLNFAEKVDRSLALIGQASERFGDQLVVANSRGKKIPSVVWHLAKRVNDKIRGFVVTTRYKPKETVRFMEEETETPPRVEGFSK